MAPGHGRTALGCALVLGCALLLAPGAGAGGAAPAARAAKKCSKAKTTTLTDGRFAPATICIRRGTRLTWKAAATNRDYHTVTVQAGSPYFHSGNLYAGDTFRHKFRKGTYVLYCIPHPEMSQTVRVR